TLTVNVTALLAPPAVVTVTSRPPVTADSAMAKLAVNEATVVTITLLTVTPAPPTSTVVPPATNPVPDSATATVLPRMPEDGLTDVSVGAGAGVGVGVGLGVGDGVGLGVGPGVGLGAGAGPGDGAGVGCGEGPGEGAGAGVTGVPVGDVSGEPHPAARRLRATSVAAILPTCMNTSRRF